LQKVWEEGEGLTLQDFVKAGVCPCGGKLKEWDEKILRCGKCGWEVVLN